MIALKIIQAGARMNQSFHRDRDANQLLFLIEHCIIISPLRTNAEAIFGSPGACETWHEC